MKRSLTLSRETLNDLTPEQLTGVAGAAAPTTPVGYCVQTLTPRTVEVRECVSNAHTCLDCLTRWC